MNVTVLGGGGFIGSHVVTTLAEQGATVNAVDIAFPALRSAWWNKAAKLTQADLRDADNVSLAVEGADFVFNLAADMGGVGYFHSDADQQAARNNMQIDLNVLAACQKHDVPFFYSSSACAYPTTSQTHETDHSLHEGMLGLGPADQLYGEEKRFMALLCKEEPLAKVGLLHTVYGPGQEVDGPRAKFPPAICRKVHEAKETGIVEIWGDGTQTRSFLYIDDAVDRILRLSGSPAGSPHTVNIGSDEEVTIKQCADWLCEHAGIEPHYEFQLDKPTGVKARNSNNGLYNTVIHEIHGQKPETITAKDGLARLYDWIAK